MDSRRTRPLRMLDAFASPRLFTVRGILHPASVDADGVIHVHETRFVVADPTDAVPPGTGLKVLVAAGFTAVTDADQAAYDANQEAMREAARATARANRIQQAAEIQAFHDSLALPFAWEPGHRVVLSGLSRNSSGNGTYRRTTYHVMLTQPFARGRLVREPGQFLCSAREDAFGSDIEQRRAPTMRVTCPRCLAAAARLTV